MKRGSCLASMCMGARQKNPDALYVRNLKNGTLPGKLVLSFNSERNDRNVLTISFHFQFVASHQGKNRRAFKD